MNSKEYLKLQLKSPIFKKVWEETEVEYQIARSLIKRRLSLGLSQEDLAKKTATKQPAISRLESGNQVPSISFLKRIAKALNSTVTIRLDPAA